MKNRLLWVDKLRIIATFGVICLHWRIITTENLIVEPFNSYCFESGTFDYYSNLFLSYVFMPCVPLFLMLSGYLMLKRDLTVDVILKKNAPKVLLMRIISWILCGIFGAFYALVRGFDLLKTSQLTVNGWGFGSSFFSVLLGMYLVTPFLGQIVKNRNLCRYFLILSIFFNLLLPPFVDLKSVHDSLPFIIKNAVVYADYSQVFIPQGSTMFYVLGYVLGEKCERISKKNAFCLFVAAFLLYIIPAMICGMASSQSSWLNIPLYGRHYGGYVSLLITIYACGTFVLFMANGKENALFLSKEADSCERVIHNIGKNTIWVFLVHGIVMSMMRPVCPHTSMPFLIETILYSMVCFGISLILALVLERIPIINKIV